MANPMRKLIPCFLLLILPFHPFSTLADVKSTLKTSSKDQVPCQMCISCDNPCPVYYPPPPPPVVYPPPPPKIPYCPPPPPTCPECPPCKECTPGAVPTVPGQPGVVGGEVYGPPSASGGAVPYFPYYYRYPPAEPITSASTSIHWKLWNACSAISLLLATLCFY
ncbi:hypothetical protein SLE2022_242800 [Rubroshorea leprosula]